MLIDLINSVRVVRFLEKKLFNYRKQFILRELLGIRKTPRMVVSCSVDDQGCILLKNSKNEFECTKNTTVLIFPPCENHLIPHESRKCR